MIRKSLYRGNIDCVYTYVYTLASDSIASVAISADTVKAVVTLRASGIAVTVVRYTTELVHYTDSITVIITGGVIGSRVGSYLDKRPHLHCSLLCRYK